MNNVFYKSTLCNIQGVCVERAPFALITKP